MHMATGACIILLTNRALLSFRASATIFFSVVSITVTKIPPTDPSSIFIGLYEKSKKQSST
ncbi:hypothetical protein D3C72_713380 [compost metagenome]